MNVFDVQGPIGTKTSLCERRSAVMSTPASTRLKADNLKTSLASKQNYMLYIYVAIQSNLKNYSHHIQILNYIGWILHVSLAKKLFSIPQPRTQQAEKSSQIARMERISFLEGWWTWERWDHPMSQIVTSCHSSTQDIDDVTIISVTSQV